jgi:hypothetical protein
MNLSLPASLSETEREEQRKIQLFAPLSVSEKGWGRGQIRLVELTLRDFQIKKYTIAIEAGGRRRESCSEVQKLDNLFLGVP